MKLKSLFLIGALLAIAITTQAQTNAPTPSIPQDFLNLVGDIGNGPWGVAGGYGHSTSGTGKNLAFGILTYDLVENASNTGFSSGLIAGEDDLWKAHAHQVNSLSGGWQFSETLNPLKFTGVSALTNVTAAVMAYEVLATPHSSSDIGSITGTAVAVRLTQFWGYKLQLVGMYENRNGQGSWDGNYFCGGLALIHIF